jgi:fructose-1-phosphate kinase PfkB-like protein
MILTVCLNPTFQKTMLFDSFSLGEVNRSRTHFLDASGKGMNTARVLSQLGEQSALLTHLGGPRKQEMLDLCRKDHVEILYADSHSEIRTCTTVICDGICTELVEEPSPVAPSTEAEIRKLYAHALPRASAVIVCGTRAPNYSADLYAEFSFEARKAGKFLLLDLKGHDLLSSLPHRPNVIKPNLSEFMHTFFGEKIGEQEQSDAAKERVVEKMRELHRLYGCSVVLSRGKRESWLFDGEFSACPTVPAKTVNTIGCGDTLNAALTTELLRGTPLRTAMEVACRYASLNAENVHPGDILGSK